MIINLNGKSVTLKYSFRAFMIYEKITQTSFSPKGIYEIIVYFYSTLLASDKSTNISFDDFMDWLDENPSVLEEFSVWLSSIISKNSYINNPDNTSTQTEKTTEDPKKD